MAKLIDIKLIDKLMVDGLAALCKVFSRKIGAIQTGYVYNYFIIMFIGFFLIVGYFIWMILL